MAGRGPAPKRERYRRNSPSRGEWQPSPEGGWQHELPDPPTGLLPASERAWESWFRAWWAGHWTPDDLPQLRFVIRLHDRVLRGDVKRLGELRQWMDAMGITPKGQQDRRWERPAPPKPKPGWPGGQDPYAHLRAVDERRAAGGGRGATKSASERFAALQRDETRTRDRLAVLEGRAK